MASGRVLGVYDAGLIDIMIGALKNLGVERAYVINSENGMDEFSTTSRISAACLMNGEIEKIMIDPVDYGFDMSDIGDLEGGDPSLNAKILEDILSGQDKGTDEGFCSI